MFYKITWYTTTTDETCYSINISTYIHDIYLIIINLYMQVSMYKIFFSQRTDLEKLLILLILELAARLPIKILFFAHTLKNDAYDN